MRNWMVGTLALAAAVLPFSAQADDSMTVVGVPSGALAANSLIAGQYQAAAERLSQRTPDSINDPARLINLGNAYAGLGRMADARDAYRAAAYAPDEMLALADGSEAPAREIARRALRRLNTAYAMK